MTATFVDDPHAINQRELVAALAGIRAALAHYATAHSDDRSARADPVDSLAADGETPDSAPDRQPPGESTMPVALRALQRVFGLSRFECEVILLCAGVEFDGAFPTLCATAQGDPRRTGPTFGLALAVLPGAHWSALNPTGPLRHWQLIEVGEGPSLVASPLRLDERILHFIAGLSYLDERLDALVEPIEAPDRLPRTYQVLAERIAAAWSPDRDASHPVTDTAGRPDNRWPLVQLTGSASAAKRAIAAAACALLGIDLHIMAASSLPLAASERETLVRLWQREAALGGGALLLEGDETDSPESVRAVRAFAERLGTPLVVASREPLPTRTRRALRLDVGPLAAAEQVDLWYAALGPLGPALNGQVEKLTAQFSLGLGEIEAASSQAIAELAPGSSGSAVLGLPPLLWEACRAQARPRLEELARRIVPAAKWDDLVLPERQRQLLAEIVAHVRQRSRVYGAWGFGPPGQRGLGISALFAGPSGTGKTMAAELLGRELRLDVWQVDLSSVISKYIGDTERKLRQVFDAAESGGVILLFDEADALFGRRSEVKDSHDRYANIEVSYLLQRMEAYSGLAILTTNLKPALDPAFLRRIRFLVDFPFPDTAQRAEIWRRIFPAATPTDGLDVDKLARLSVAGGNIRNIAMNAAFLAAEVGEPVRMSHLLRAARSEYAKLERPLADAEIRGWVP
jgi:AAA+ superfamily predicted ATPase